MGKLNGKVQVMFIEGSAIFDAGKDHGADEAVAHA